MNLKPQISGIHHITAIASSAVENLKFYETILSLRMVKQTINFDDPYTYHLYYGDDSGSPGTILTFFLWENLPREKPGAGMVTSIAFAVPQKSLDFWKQRIIRFGYQVEEEERFGDPVIRFSDPHGLALELIGMADPPQNGYWEAGPITRTNAIKGFHSATATLNKLQESKTLLTDLMGMTLIDQQKNRYRFIMNDRKVPGHFFDLLVDPKEPTGRPGGGTFHHIAFRTNSDSAQLYWQSTLRNAGIPVTDIRDRKYFRSIYFHSPEKVLFEIATDAPGFTVDESVENLGNSLMLPDQYELIRPAIEKHLRPLRTGHPESVLTTTVENLKSEHIR
jgi:glyoxalase family protein